LKLNVDPQTQTIEAEVQIKGQPEPLKLTVEGYELTSSGGQDQLRWSRITIEGATVNLPPGIKDKLSYVM
jgi:hypothetical protein